MFFWGVIIKQIWTMRKIWLGQSRGEVLTTKFGGAEVCIGDATAFSFTERRGVEPNI
jgi:hypothetical protein